MRGSIHGLLSFSQVVMQRVALAIVIALATTSVAWSVAALLGWAPWMHVDLGWTSDVGAGPVVQSVLTLFLVGLCFFLPTNARVMALERSHRAFKVSMEDVAAAYQAVHAADRDGAFELRSEYDSVRDRLTYLLKHPDLRDLEPELLELAAQMSYESRALAETYSCDRVERARGFLKQRQEEAQKLQEQIGTAHSVCHGLRRWLERVEVDEAVARSQLKRLEDDLEELLPAIGLSLTRVHVSAPELPTIGIAAE